MMKRLGVAVLAAMLLSGCEEGVLDLTIEATGKIVDHATNQPIQGVTVTLYEADDAWWGGTRVLDEQLTDADGNFGFNFEWKESPYNIRVKKEGYTYTRVVQSDIFNTPPLITDYQAVDRLKKKQELVFDMEPLGSLLVNINNTEPQPNNNKLTVKFDKVNKATPTVAPEPVIGTSITGLRIGAYAIAKKHVRYTYTIEKNGASQTKVDSVLIKHLTPTVLDINY